MVSTPKHVACAGPPCSVPVGSGALWGPHIAGTACGFVSRLAQSPHQCQQSCSLFPLNFTSQSTFLLIITLHSPQLVGGRQFLPLVKKVGIGEVLVQSQHPTFGFKNRGAFHSVQLLYGEALFITLRASPPNTPLPASYVPSFIFL